LLGFLEALGTFHGTLRLGSVVGLAVPSLQQAVRLSPTSKNIAMALRAFGRPRFGPRGKGVRPPGGVNEETIQGVDDA
jgi:hypothetical protein